MSVEGGNMSMWYKSVEGGRWRGKCMDGWRVCVCVSVRVCGGREYVNVL